MVVDATWWQQLGHRWRHLVDELVAGDHLVILCQRPRWSRLAAGNLELSGNFGPLQPTAALTAASPQLPTYPKPHLPTIYQPLMMQRSTLACLSIKILLSIIISSVDQ